MFTIPLRTPFSLESGTLLICGLVGFLRVGCTEIDAIPFISVSWRVASSAVIDEEFERWQNEVKEAEAEAGVTNDEVAADDERPSSPPDGKEEFTDDDGTAYKWDKKIR
ncbi:hypothetical protein Tco_0549006, partial [Tanacetum coccineum]